MNRRGPRTEPWGTPREETQEKEKELWHLTRKDQDDKWDLKQFKTDPRNPNQEERWVIKMLWSVVSKAAERSRRQRQEIFWESVALMSWSWIWRRAVFTTRCYTNPRLPLPYLYTCISDGLCNTCNCHCRWWCYTDRTATGGWHNISAAMTKVSCLVTTLLKTPPHPKLKSMSVCVCLCACLRLSAWCIVLCRPWTCPLCKAEFDVQSRPSCCQQYWSGIWKKSLPRKIF